MKRPPVVDGIRLSVMGPANCTGVPHVAPRFEDEIAPPSVQRPSSATATMVEPAENVSGSTTVLCWQGWVELKGSVRISLLPFAEAPAETTSAATATSARVRVSLLGFMCSSLLEKARGRLA